MTILLSVLAVAAVASLVIVWLSQRDPTQRGRAGRRAPARTPPPGDGRMSLALAGVFVILAVAASLLLVFLTGVRI